MGDNGKNYAQLAQLVKMAMGERSMSKYSRDTGVSVSHISRLINQNLKSVPSPEIISKLTNSENANPRSGVTYEDMMIAAGYQNKYFEQLTLDTVDLSPVSHSQGMSLVAWYEEMMKQSESGSSDIRNTEEEQKSNIPEEEPTKRNKLIREHKNIRMAASRFEATAIGIIYSSLAQKNTSFQAVPTSEFLLKGYHPDAIIKFSSAPINVWWLEFMYFDESDYRYRSYYRIRCFDLVGKLAMQEPDPKRAVSIITNSPLVFEYFRSASGKISYRGNLTIVLLDEEHLNVMDEICLSTYKENGSNVLLMK